MPQTGPDSWAFDSVYAWISPAEEVEIKALREQLTAEESEFVIPGPFYHTRCFWYSISDDECFSVSSDDLLTAEDLVTHWKLVEAADREEVKSFVANKIFKLDLRRNATNKVDGTWVRRWKNRAKLTASVTH